MVLSGSIAATYKDINILTVYLCSYCKIELSLTAMERKAP